MDRLVAYISHPIGEDAHGGEMHDNIARLTEWIKFLVEKTQYVLVCPWLTYLVALGGNTHAPRRLIDSMGIIERCDVVLQLGYLNPHMINYEAKAARRVGTPIADLTSFGVLPPEPTPETVERIQRTIERAIKRQPRRVWMPLLTAHDIDALKKMMRDLQPGEHAVAIALLERILIAAYEHGSET